MSWRPAFLINVPIGITLLFYARTGLPVGKGTRTSIDIIGILLLSFSLLLVVGPLIFGPESGWPNWVWICLALGVAGLWGFWKHETALTRSKDRPTPLINVEALLTQGIRSGLLVISIGFIGYGGWLFSAALYLQSDLGHSALVSGSVFTAYALGFGIANVNWSKLPSQFLRWTPTAALLVMIVANLAFGLVALFAGWSPIIMVPLLFCAGSSHGLAFGTTVNQMTIRTPSEHAPTLSGLVTSSVQLSIVIGIAILGGIYFATANSGGEISASFPIAIVTFAIAGASTVALYCSVRLALISLPSQI